MLCLNKIYEMLEELKSTNIKIIIFDYQKENQLLSCICRRIEEERLNIQVVTHLDCTNMHTNKEVVKRVSPKEMKEILKLYSLYEFSDRIIVLSDRKYFPNMMNYASQGILEIEELVETILKT